MIDYTPVMVGDINIRNYGISSVSLISEATWSPRLIVKHFNGKEFSSSLTRDHIEELKNNNIDIINYMLWTHIKKECIVWLRKEKLQKLDSLKFIDVQL
jgi:hypothetical protein